jgi:hypothetical protein
MLFKDNIVDIRDVIERYEELELEKNFHDDAVAAARDHVAEFLSSQVDGRWEIIAGVHETEATVTAANARALQVKASWELDNNSRAIAEMSSGAVIGIRPFSLLITISLITQKNYLSIADTSRATSRLGFISIGKRPPKKCWSITPRLISKVSLTTTGTHSHEKEFLLDFPFARADCIS